MIVNDHILIILLLNEIVLLIYIKNFWVNFILVQHLFLSYNNFFHKWVQLIDEHDDTISVNWYTQSHKSNEEILLKDLKTSVYDRMND